MAIAGPARKGRHVGHAKAILRSGPPVRQDYDRTAKDMSFIFVRSERLRSTATNATHASPGLPLNVM